MSEFEQIKTKIADHVVADLGGEYVDVAEKIGSASSYRKLFEILDEEEMSPDYALMSLTSDEKRKLQLERIDLMRARLYSTLLSI